MVKRDAPCKDCSDRHLGCHSECESYKLFKAANLAAYRVNYHVDSYMTHRENLYRHLVRKGDKIVKKAF